jgi:putative DNA primase/helicase
VLKDNGGIMEERPVLPPTWVAAILSARGEWPFPPLEGVIEAPALRLDGSILNEPGYDTASGLLYLPSIEFPPVPESPTKGDAIAAAQSLLDPLGDFPFVGDSDRAAAIAAALTLVGRNAIAGPVPCFAVRAPTPGTGKTLLVDVAAIIATGRVASRMTVPRDDDEGRKRILSIGIEGAPIVLLDNVEGALGSPSLAAALTGTEFADRLLGVSKIVRVPIRTVWFATGNGLTFKGDLGRRVVPIDLDPKVEHPEDRLGFRYPDLLPHVRSERPRLLVAALTILRAFDLAGRPGHGKPKVGTFEEWDDLVRGAVMWLGLNDPVAGRERVREEGDADLDLIRAVYVAWHAAFEDVAKTVAEAIAAAASEDELKRELRSALAALDLRGDGTRLNSRVVADRLKRWKGRVVAGLRLETAGKHHQAMLWRVVPAGPPDSGQTRGEEADPGSQTSEGNQLPVDLDLDTEDGRESWCSGESFPSRLDFESELSRAGWESGEFGESDSEGDE